MVIRDSGYFVPEEQPEAIANALPAFLWLKRASKIQLAESHHRDRNG
jgi:hypothetical protein